MQQVYDTHAKEFIERREVGRRRMEYRRTQIEAEFLLVQDAALPAYNPATQRVEPADPVQVQGAWTRSWVVIDKTEEELAEYVAQQASEVRASRNARLAECDWTQLADSPVDKEVWATYRQALRDITSQEGFPLNIEWPVKP